MFHVGDTVTATVRLYEVHPDGRRQCVARPGDRGTVQYVSTQTELPLVRFERSGWAVDCNASELTEVSHG